MSKLVWRIHWDNGNNACGTFPWEYEDEAQADREGEAIQEENRRTGVWDEDGFCEAFSTEEPTEDELEEAAEEEEQSLEYFDRYIAGDR